MSALLEELRAELAAGDVVVIAGAGTSLAATGGHVDAGWSGLLHHAVDWSQERALLTTSQGSALRDMLADPEKWVSAAEQVTEALRQSGGGDFARFLQTSVGALPLLDASVPAALTGLGAPILTTNYDTLIEQATGWRSTSWQVEGEAAAAIRERQQVVVHLHGVWDVPTSVVFGSRSYERILRVESLQAVERAVLTLKSVLYVGVGAGVNDPHFHALREWAVQTHPGDRSQHFRICARAQLADLRRAHGTERIRPLAFDETHPDLASFLEDLGASARSVGAGASPRVVVARNVEPWNIPRPSVDLRGRDDLGAHLLAERDQRLTALIGSPGLGKTSAAIRLAWDLRQAGRVKLGWIVRAEDDETMLRDLAKLGEELRLPEPEDVQAQAQQLVEHLERKDVPPFVLIFDNVPDARRLDHLVPLGNGRIIATSRNPTGWKGRAEIVVLEELDGAAAAGLLCELSGLPDLAEAEALVEVLGGNPLALENAARLAERMGWSFATYLDRLDVAPDWILDEAFEVAEQTLARAVSTSLGHLSGLARDLFALAAWFQPDAIPRFLFEGPTAEAELGAPLLDIDAAIGRLLQLSLLKAQPERANVVMHRSLQLIGRQLEPASAPLDRALRLVAACWPTDVEEPAAQARADVLLPHLAQLVNHGLDSQARSAPFLEAVLAVADYYRVSGSARAAYALVEEVAGRFEDADDLLVERAKLQVLLGRLWSYVPGKGDERRAWGIERYRRALELARECGSDELIAIALIRGAFLLYQDGQVQEADGQTAEAFTLVRGAGPSARALVAVLGLHVENMIRLGRYRLALDAAMEMHEVVFGFVLGPHPLRSYAENQLAMASSRANLYFDALAGYRRAVDESESALAGRETGSLAIRYANLAWALLTLDRAEEGLRWARRALDVSARVGAADSAMSLRRAYVADALSLLGHPDAAREWAEVEKAAASVSDSALASRLRFVARHYRRVGEHGIALEKLRLAQSLLDGGATMRIQYVEEVRRDLGEAEWRAGDPDRGLSLLRESLVAFESMAGAEHRDTALTRMKLAGCLAATDPVAARELAVRGAADLAACLGADHRDAREAGELAALLVR